MIDYLLPSKAATVQALGHPAAGIIGWSDAADNTSGMTVDQTSALTLCAVWCAVRVISETIATLPCMLYRRKSDDSRERATTDPRYWLLTEQPHPHMNAVTFFESMTAAMVLHGNCYAEIATAMTGDVGQLEPRHPDTVSVDVDGDTLVYNVSDPAAALPADRMLHVAGLGGDGLTGWSVIKYAQQSLGSALAAEQTAGAQFGNGGTPNGVLTHPMRLDKAAREHLRKEWEDVHKGSTNAGRVAIMHGGMEFKPITMPNDDMQFLESRQFSIRDVARWFRLPPHMLADLADSSVRANIEQQAIEFIVYSLKPWLTRWQQTLNRKLLYGEEKRQMYFEFLLESLLQGDSAAQAQAWSIGRQWGWYSVNDIRKMQNLPPVDGGDVYLQPSNMVPADSEAALGKVPEPPPPMLPGQPQEPEEDIQEEESEALRENWRESIAAIIESGRKQLEGSLNGKLAQYADIATQCEHSAANQLKTLRETRAEIHRDIMSPAMEYVRGCDEALVESANTLLRDHMAIAVKREKGDIAKASKAVARGSELNAWLDKYYTEHQHRLEQRLQPACHAYRVIRPHCSDTLAHDVSKATCETHKADIIAASRGNRSGCAERVQVVLDQWDDEVKAMSLGD